MPCCNSRERDFETEQIRSLRYNGWKFGVVVLPLLAASAYLAYFILRYIL